MMIGSVRRLSEDELAEKKRLKKERRVILDRRLQTGRRGFAAQTNVMGMDSFM